MKAVKSLNKWANKHNSFYQLDILRWTLGIFLFIKGLDFMTNTGYLVELLSPREETFATLFIMHYVSLVHISGGILITAGLLTRMAVAFQIPILIGAISINFIGVMDPSNLLMASLVLLLSIGFLIVGSGNHSVDYRLKMEM